MTESIQLVILMPLLLGIFFGAIQAGIVASARVAVRDAAFAAAEAASLAVYSREDVARRVAEEVAARSGVTDITVTTHAGDDTLTVDVAGSVTLAVGINQTLAASATMPLWR